MALRNLPIRRKLMAITLVTSGVVLLLTCSAFFAYEFVTFRQHMVTQMTMLGKVIAANSTAALTFDNRDDAKEVLSALAAARHVGAAALYDKNGKLFSSFPADLTAQAFPATPGADGYRFTQAHLVGYQPVVQRGNQRVGTLYLKADMGDLYERLRLYAIIATSVIAVSFLAAYLISRTLQKQISQPIIGLAETARAVSERNDYSVRAAKLGRDELGLLTDAFNQMLTHIQTQTAALKEKEEHLTKALQSSRLAEEEVRSLNKNLETRVRQRTDQLETANNELEAFSYSVSHDLRAPLRHVQGYVELLAKHAGDTLNDKGRRYLNIASESVTQMGDLIDDLLEFARTGRAEMRQTTVALDELVPETFSSLESEIKGRNIVWKNGRLPSVQGDPSLLKQVFVNLLSNAIKYTRPRDPAHIEIGVASETAEEVVVFIRDNGVGFDMAYVDKLFGVFQRLHGAEEFEGTGIGLANVRRIITRHGGRIWAEAEIDKGATFYFTLNKAQNEKV